MAGVTPILPPRTGCIDGKLEVKTDRFVILDELLRSLPSEKAFLKELISKGWHYYFIEGFGTVVLEIDISATDYKWQAQEHPRGGFAYNLSLEFGRRLPNVGFKTISNLDRFIINICSKDQSRGVTIDLKSKKITYVHDSLWDLKNGPMAAGVKDILSILQWLTKERKYTFGMKAGMEHYKKLLSLAESEQKPRRVKA